MSTTDTGTGDLPELRAFIRSKKAALAGFMELGAGLQLVGDVLRVVPRSDIYVRYLNDNRGAIARLASEFCGRPITVEIGPVQETQSEAAGTDNEQPRPGVNLESICVRCGHPLAVCWEDTSCCWSSKCGTEPEPDEGAPGGGADAQVGAPSMVRCVRCGARHVMDDHDCPAAEAQQPQKESPRRHKKVDFALAYARRGFKVFPCNYIERDRECSCGKLKCSSAGKHPRYPGWQQDATTDEATIAAWWKEDPEFNIGIACGEASGITVLDVDPRHQGDESLRELELEHGELPVTPMIQSGGGGTHYYFQYEPELHNDTDIAPGLDLKNSGGLVIGAGSVNGVGPYRWMVGYEPSDSLQPSKMPHWLFEKIKQKQGATKTAGDGFKVPPKIPAGQRNTELFKAGRSAKARNVPAGGIRAELEAINRERCEPPVDADELEQIYQSVLTGADQAGFGERQGAPGKKHRLQSVMVNEVQPTRIHPLWAAKRLMGAIYLGRGKLHGFEGDPGVNKTTMLADLCARISTGTEFPDGWQCRPGRVIYVSGEEGDSDGMRPLLQAAGADLSMIRLITFKQGLPMLPDDIPGLREFIYQDHAAIVVLDPVDSFYSDKVDPNKNVQVRRVLTALAHLSDETKAIIAPVRHLNKDSNNTRAMYRGAGSIAFTAACRALYLVGVDPKNPDRRILACTKNNMGPLPPARGFEVVSATVAADDGSEIQTRRIEWREEVKLTADDLLRPGAGLKDEPSPEKLETASEFLLEMLRDGERPSRELIAKAEGRLIKYRTLARAATDLKVQKRKDGYGDQGIWFWKLPDGVFQQ